MTAAALCKRTQRATRSAGSCIIEKEIEDCESPEPEGFGLFWSERRVNSTREKRLANLWALKFEGVVYAIQN